MRSSQPADSWRAHSLYHPSRTMEQAPGGCPPQHCPLRRATLFLHSEAVHTGVGPVCTSGSGHPKGRVTGFISCSLHSALNESGVSCSRERIFQHTPGPELRTRSPRGPTRALGGHGGRALRGMELPEGGRPQAGRREGAPLGQAPEEAVAVLHSALPCACFCRVSCSWTLRRRVFKPPLDGVWARLSASLSTASC